MAWPSLLRTALIALFAGTLAFAPAQAADAVSIQIETTVEYVIGGNADAEADADFESEAGFDADDSEISDALLSDDMLAGDAAPVRRFAPAPALSTAAQRGPRFGPFSVVGGTTARMAGDVTSATPRQFAAMLAAHPGIKRLELVDCPGSLDEDANLALARAVRRAGIATHVPAGGSVRSGAVELFLAGATRSAHPSAEFGVHSWRDQDGREAGDFPADHPVHAEYLNFYREMGMDDARARAFYAMTNATGFDAVRYLTRADMTQYVALN
jgi:hypothetical protein